MRADAWVIMSIDRNQRERERLRTKRRDPDYLKCQRIRRAAQMRATRCARLKAGKCRECDQQAQLGHSYCPKHLAYERQRASKNRGR